MNLILLQIHSSSIKRFGKSILSKNISNYQIKDIYEKEQDQFGDMNYTEPTEEDLKAIKGSFSHYS